MAKNDVLRLRIQDDLKHDAEDLAASLDISTSQLARMALREMIARHKAAGLQETGSGYTATSPPLQPARKRTA